MNERERSTVTRLGFLVAIVLFIFGFFYISYSNVQSKNEITDYKSSIKSSNADINEYNRKIKQMTVPYIYSQMKMYNGDNYDLTAVLNKNQSQLQDGINASYSMSSEDDYKALPDKIKDSLGKKMTKKIMSLTKPIINQSGKSMFPYSDAKSVDVAFSSYNYVTKQLTGLVVVNYDTPDIGNETPGGTNTESKSLSGYDLYTISVSKNGQIDLMRYDKSSDVGGIGK